MSAPTEAQVTILAFAASHMSNGDPRPRWFQDRFKGEDATAAEECVVAKWLDKRRARDVYRPEVRRALRLSVAGAKVYREALARIHPGVEADGCCSRCGVRPPVILLRERDLVDPDAAKVFMRDVRVDECRGIHPPSGVGRERRSIHLHRLPRPARRAREARGVSSDHAARHGRCVLSALGEAAKVVVDAWPEGWDCSASPGHETFLAKVQELVAAAEAVDVPETQDFLVAVEREAQHQRSRWGSEHDGGKAPQDWFWLLGWLAGKAVHAAVTGDVEKAKHHTISSAASLLNWHAALSGTSTRMRPGIAAPAEGGAS